MMIKNKNLIKIYLKNLLLSISLLIIIGLLLEVSLRLFWPQIYKVEYLDGKAPGINDEELGVIFRPNAHWREQKPEFDVEYHTNNVGLRGGEDYPEIVNDNKRNILILGSSTTFGAGIEYDKIWPVVFEKKFLKENGNIRIIKAGLFTVNTASMVLYLERVYSKYKPDVVIVALPSAVILSNLSIPSSKNITTKYNNNIFKMVKNKPYEFNLVLLLKRLIRMNDYAFSVYNIDKGWGKLFNKNSNYRDTKLEITKNLFVRMKNFLDKKESKLIVVAIPENSQMLIEANHFNIKDIDPKINDNELTEFALKNKFIFISALEYLSSWYSNNRKKLFYRLDGHLNSEGHRLLGSFIFDNFKKFDK